MLVPIYRIALIRNGSRRARRKEIDTPEDACEIFRAFIGPADRENLVVMTLDSMNRPLGLNLVSIGDLNSAIAAPREVFKLAVLQNAASIILAHNHPSGIPIASADDLDVTVRIQEAGKLMGIELLDHIIIGDSEFVSLSEKGFLEEWGRGSRIPSGAALVGKSPLATT